MFSDVGAATAVTCFMTKRGKSRKKKRIELGEGRRGIRLDPVCRGRGSTPLSHWAIGFNKTHQALHFSPTASEAAPELHQGCIRVAPGLRRAPASPGRLVLASLQRRLPALRFARASHSRLHLTHSIFSIFPASTTFDFLSFATHVTVAATWVPAATGQILPMRPRRGGGVILDGRRVNNQQPASVISPSVRRGSIRGISGDG